MTNLVAYDLSRLFSGLWNRIPRGLDRVDLAYSQHFFGLGGGECVGVLPTPFGMRLFDQSYCLQLAKVVESQRGETLRAEADPVYRWLKDKLLNRPASATQPKTRPAVVHDIGSFAKLLRKAGFSLGRSATALPLGTIYLNVGQTLSSHVIPWLGLRKDIKPVFMLHDIIPIEHPELVVAPDNRTFAQKFHDIIGCAQGLIVTAQTTGRSIEREIAKFKDDSIPMVAAPLPVPPSFLTSRSYDSELDNVSYFIISGTLEPRKNHILLLQVWRELVARHAQGASKLVIAGSRWRTDADVAAMLEHCASLKGFVTEVEGLSSPALRQVVIGARASLMPSLAEGYGLPIVEALAVGTPVIASDLRSHREVGGDLATYLSPRDNLAWLAAIERNMADPTPASERSPNPGYLPQQDADYFRLIEDFLNAL